MKQKELFVVDIEKKPNDMSRSLYEIIWEFKNGKIIKPEFQRDPCWPDVKIKSWWKTLLDGSAIGVIVTYQLQGGSPTYLADGMQRISATIKGLDFPEDYKFPFGTEQAEEICRSFTITVQHRIYRDHFHAMEAFHRLNNGLGLTPLEYYAGLLKLDKVGSLVYKTIPELVFNVEKALLSGEAGSREIISKMSRDSLALFFQYISKYKGMTFWGVASSKIPDSPVERSMEGQLVQFINDNSLTRKAILKKINSFEKYLEDQIVFFQYCIRESGQEGKAMNKTLLRYLLHLSIWRKNNSTATISLYEQFLMAFFNIFKEHKNFTSRFQLPDVEPIKLYTVGISHLGDLKELCHVLNVPLHKGYKREKRTAIRGMHNSHIKPLSRHGENDVFYESAVKNMGRGANSVKNEAQLSKLR